MNNGLPASVAPLMHAGQPLTTPPPGTPPAESVSPLAGGSARRCSGVGSPRGSLPAPYSPESGSTSPVKWRELTLGCCAMDKKVKAPPMQAILRRLRETGDFRIVEFGDDVILGQPVEEWPVVDCLIAFYSDGFPLDKAEAYEQLRRPFMVNSLREQRWLQDRRKMYAVLQRHGITMPHHAVCSRSPSGDPDFPWPVVSDHDFEETDDAVTVGGVTVRKPFVEKPADADNHNVCIYFPSTAGGGMKALFRKIGDKSAEFFPERNRVRRDGSYLYESFVKSGGTDIKVYTVGPDYAHAEARKSPVVDGKVQRDADGKELRYPILLSNEEKEMARTVVLAFNQNVCGMDILRTPSGQSYVIDVNGWSAVKKSTKYYDDCASILRAICMVGCGMERHFRRSSPHQDQLLHSAPASPIELPPPDPGVVHHHPRRHHHHPGGPADAEELRCVLLIARHGDRTPKQKMKLKCSFPQVLALHSRWASGPKAEAKLKSPTQLGEMLTAARELVEAALVARRRRQSAQLAATEGSRSVPRGLDCDEMLSQLVLLQKVLKEGGHFSGINRKVQLKPTAWQATESGGQEVSELLLVLKYGGVLTPAGRQQAESLGREVRETMYPSSDAGGLLRLHSTYRHDLKIYCSDEGRVQISAAAFTRGLLDLEGALTPILVSMVHKDTRMLDDVPQRTAEDICQAKQALQRHILNQEPAGDGKELEGMTPGEDNFRLLQEMLRCMETLTAQLRDLALFEIQTLADSREFSGSDRGTSPPGGNSPGSGMRRRHSRRDSQQDHACQRSCRRVGSPAADVERISEVMHMSGAEALAGELAGTGVFHVTTAGKATMWTDADERAPRPDGESSPSDRSTPPMAARVPYGGESPTMMHMRWDRLLRQLRNKEKDKWDLSKVPDVVDSVKYDMIHNSHMGLDIITRLNDVASKLGRGVVANEYGVDRERRLRIGSTIMCPLLLKLMDDLQKVCVATTPQRRRPPSQQGGGPRGALGGAAQPKSGPPPSPSPVDAAVARLLESSRGRRGATRLESSAFSALSDGSALAQRAASTTTERLTPTAEADVGSRKGTRSLASEREETVRLDPLAAGESGIRSGSRSVVTRVYFTSESHIYGLMNVLRGAGSLVPAEGDDGELVSPEAEGIIRNGPSFDYLSHIVLRVFERLGAPAHNRFRVEVAFSPGAAGARPAPDDRRPPPLQPRYLLSTPWLGMGRTAELLAACTRSPPVISGAWDERESDGDARETFSVGHCMRQHNRFPMWEADDTPFST
eukprot:TRINITY_DN50664_c0_g1_i1.p1 TRINITY_DN50664_c0_g1~~TRINITY_DN50664_c0_g1_i1.p1  ORF type:complete len:1266 (+),score=291.52 TRINITY_DN50664_c0_g1_i1:75-3872(+)